ncbi:MAG: rRNA cytosine-C5-methyltransferase [Bacteroidales bacterium]|nr:rRNA cytosine-C5-methyltransferase [Bacteroidales bacterium]
MKFPIDFISSITPILGSETESFLSALSDTVPVSFRMNPSKSLRNPMRPTVPYEKVPWSEWGFYLQERPAFTFDPLFHAGYYYVQEASSMFVEYLVNQLVREPMVCLDLCGAPGGKSISLLSALPEGSLLVSNEMVRQRSHLLSETMLKFGHPNWMVTNNSAKDFSPFPSLFDLVLVDAPCSGEGMFRKDEIAVAEWSLQNVEMCAARQRDIVADIWPSLKPGGLLIYSTCTFNTTENEDNALWAATELGAECVYVEREMDWAISPAFDSRVTAYRFFPHKSKGEGLFVAVLRKKEEGAEKIISRARGMKNRRKSSPFVKDPAPYASLLLHPDSFAFMEREDRIVALPAEYSDVFIMLDERLKIVSMGIEIGERKGRDFIPSHSLALSRELNPDAFPRFALTYEEAISYLRREAIALPDAPKGYLLLTYKDEPLGFVKNIGNRANNLYPNEWRIRSGHLPEKRAEFFNHP